MEILSTPSESMSAPGRFASSPVVASVQLSPPLTLPVWGWDEPIRINRVNLGTLHALPVKGRDRVSYFLGSRADELVRVGLWEDGAERGGCKVGGGEESLEEHVYVLWVLFDDRQNGLALDVFELLVGLRVLRVKPNSRTGRGSPTFIIAHSTCPWVTHSQLHDGLTVARCKSNMITLYSGSAPPSCDTHDR